MGLSLDSVSRAQLRGLAVEALIRGQTLAGRRVFADHAQPMEIEELPALLVATPAERKETAGSGAPQFHATITLAVMARVAAPTEAQTEAQLDQLIDQVQSVVLGDPALVSIVMRYEFVETLATLSADGEQMVGEATIMFGALVYQQYEPLAGAPLVDLHVTIPAGDAGPPVVFDATPPQ